MAQNILEVHKLSKRFGTFVAVHEISFSLEEGEIIGLLGPNGAGKTTTIQLLLNLMTPSSGEITYFGKPLSLHREEILSRINYSFGYSRLPWRLTSMENLIVYGWLYEVKDAKKKIYELAERFEASHLLSRKTNDLSAGELTRVFLVKAFLNDPQIILLDEPTASLDPDIAEKIRSFILDERKRRKLSLLITSHNMAEMEEMCDRIVFLHRGEVLAIDSPQNLARKRKESELHLMITSGFENFLTLIKRKGYRYTERKNFIVTFLPEGDIAKFVAEISKSAIEFSEIEIVHPSLEDFFIAVSQERGRR